ncbi:hypothetical protein ACFLWR_05760 [Chloroflexota bacterium]
MKKTNHITGAYVRRRAGQELYLYNRPLETQVLIESIEEDYKVRLSIEEANQLFTKYLDESHLSIL